MELSEKRLAANRANAKKSTGPRTPGGKHNTSKNALKHGLLAATVLVDGESRDIFNTFVDSLIKEHRPTSPTEQVLVETMAAAHWGLMRARAVQTSNISYEMHRQVGPAASEKPAIRTMLALRAVGDNSRHTMSRYESHYDRQYHRALRSLERLRAQKVDSPKQTHHLPENIGTMTPESHETVALSDPDVAFPGPQMA